MKRGGVVVSHFISGFPSCYCFAFHVKLAELSRAYIDFNWVIDIETMQII